MKKSILAGLVILLSVPGFSQTTPETIAVMVPVTQLFKGMNLGDSAKVTGIVRTTTFSGSIETDGRKGDWSWALAGRRTWIDQALNLANRLSLINFTLSYFFYDWQGDLAWSHGRDSVRLSAYQGRDDLNMDPLILNWGNQDFPLNVHLQLTPSLAYEGTVAWSGFDQVFSLSDVLRFENSIETINTRLGRVQKPRSSGENRCG